MSITQEMFFENLGRSNRSWIAKFGNMLLLGNPKEQGEPSAKRGDSRKRLRESGSQTDDDSEHVEPKLSTSHCLDAMNAKLDELLATCSENKTLKNEICGLRGELKDLKDSLDFAHQEIETLKAEFAKTARTLNLLIRTSKHENANSARKGKKYPLRASAPHSQKDAKSETTESSKTSDY